MPEIRRAPFRVLPFRQYGVSPKISALGIGGEIATPLAQHFNLRMGANFLNFNHNFSSDNWNYGAQFNLRSGQVQLDYFPTHGGFHISPGMLIHKNGGVANISIASGTSFSLGDGTYTSSPSDPVKGQATFTYDHSVAPMLTFGFGNLIPRSGRHWSIPVEIGAAFTQAPKFGLTLDGTVCDSSGCGKISSQAESVQDLATQRVQVQNDLNSYARFYPVVSLGFAWNFGPRS